MVEWEMSSRWKAAECEHYNLAMKNALVPPLNDTSFCHVHYCSALFQHPAICKFPSDQFYDGELETHRNLSWTASYIPIWPSKDRPIVFCHVEGAEKSLTVSTAEGNQQSKSNDAERDHAVSNFFLQGSVSYNI